MGWATISNQKQARLWVKGAAQQNTVQSLWMNQEPKYWSVHLAAVLAHTRGTKNNGVGLQSFAGLMDGGESIFDSIFEEEHLEDAPDVEMLDVEEGEVIERNLESEAGQKSGGDSSVVNQESRSKNRRRKDNKKRNKRKKGSSGSNVTDVNRFVLDVCKRLKERKSYLVWTAVGCLGVSALSDLVKEVDVIQACGGQKTANERRFRTGGGILWSILKVRDPNAYKEIMKKGKEFEVRYGPFIEKHEAPYFFKCM
ncbi:hypothetical protein RJ639_014862 [Escallonia herrerae]|uniref:Phosphorylated adapter RNA export protein n=1 Tax=Escallonia herrerae TaxID=1293975 RepID=A0AA88VNX9_9ASTE|nr:hypothetical protein RJ639_014862 [Escallonia herrerae]